jgi:3-oxoadipate enol-lactonase
MLDFIVQGDPESPPVVLLHAGGMTRREWDPFLDAWSARLRLIAITALGHGASPRAAELRVETLVSSTLEVLDHLGIRRAHFAGSSLGGTTALRIALSRPERVGRLVLYRCGYRIHPGMKTALERFASRENWQRWGLERWMSVEHAPQGGPSAWTEVVRRVAQSFSLEAARPEVTGEDLAGFDHPVLLISGDRDELVPLPEVLEMFRAFPRASLWVVPGAGHLMGMETWRREAFEREIARFLLGR